MHLACWLHARRGIEGRGYMHLACWLHARRGIEGRGYMYLASSAAC